MINETIITFIAEHRLGYLQGRAVELIAESTPEATQLAISCLQQTLLDRAVPVTRPLLPQPVVDDIPDLQVRQGALRKGKGAKPGWKVCDRCGKSKGPQAYSQGAPTCRLCRKTEGATKPAKRGGDHGKRECSRCHRTLGVTGFPRGSQVCHACAGTRRKPKQVGVQLRANESTELPPNSYVLSKKQYEAHKKGIGNNTLYGAIRAFFPHLKSSGWGSIILYSPNQKYVVERVTVTEILNEEAA